MTLPPVDAALEVQFQSYLKNALRGELSESDRAVKHLRAAFMAGSLVTMARVSKVLESGDPDDVIAAFESIRQELVAYSESLQKGVDLP